jgi:signal transduction histidine kinase
MGNLASGVAHDMNNVLGAILGLASTSIEDEAPGSPSQMVFATIIKAAERGTAMVKKLLSFARQTPTEERELSLHGVLQEEIQLLEHTTLSRVRIQTEFASDLRPMLGDAGALSHAFMNLCVNAVDAMPEKGTLTFRTRNVGQDWIEASVEDTGVGMTKEILAQAMDPFFTTKGVGKGTGLGLSMVYSTVKAHHGQIEIHSEPNKGTRVVMGFPAYAPAAQPDPPVARPPVPAIPKGLKVWVVDDDELIQQSISHWMKAS